MSDPNYKGENSRQYYRVVYPVHERPSIRIGENDFEVVDLSEKGVKFRLNGYRPAEGEKGFEKDMLVKATITLHEGDPVDVLGNVLRTNDEEVVICMRKGVRFSRIIREQWYLKAKYKHLM